jgi:hypothetical protein
MNCDKCDKMLTRGETSNKVLKDVGLRSGGQTLRVEKLLCDVCYEQTFKDLIPEVKK